MRLADAWQRFQVWHMTEAPWWVAAPLTVLLFVGAMVMLIAIGAAWIAVVTVVLSALWAPVYLTTIAASRWGIAPTAAVFCGLVLASLAIAVAAHRWGWPRSLGEGGARLFAWMAAPWLMFLASIAVGVLMIPVAYLMASLGLEPLVGLLCVGPLPNPFCPD